MEKEDQQKIGRNKSIVHKRLIFCSLWLTLRLWQSATLAYVIAHLEQQTQLFFLQLDPCFTERSL